MKNSESLKSFGVFSLLCLAIFGLMAFSSPALYELASISLIALDTCGVHCAEQSTRLLRFPAEHHSATAQAELGRRYALGVGVSKDFVQARHWLEMAATAGDTDAQLNLAFICLYNRDPAAHDPALAFKWLKEAASHDDEHAQLWLSHLYSYGLGTPQDLKQAFFYCKQSADHNDAYAQWQVARMYLYGLGTTKSENAAVEFAKKASDQGYTHGQYLLATLLISGTGTQADQTKGIALLTKAAEHGSASAQKLIALIYHCQMLGTHNVHGSDRFLAMLKGSHSSIATYLAQSTAPQSVSDLSQAAKSGDAHALSVMALMYHTGCGGTRDQKQAFALCRSAAEKGDADAQLELSKFFRYGMLDGHPQLSEVEKWEAKAALAGSAAAEYELGDDNLLGVNAAFNPEKGFKLIENAATAGDTDARVLLAWIYLEDDPLGGLKKATSLLEKAAEHGDVVAQYKLSEMNGKDGQAWRNKAAEQGWGPALIRRADGVIVGILDERDVAKGTKILETLTAAGDSKATASLASYRRFGLFGVPQDQAEAFNLYKKLAERGNVAAQLDLGDMIRLKEVKGHDKAEACNWYKKAAAAGDEAAKRKLTKHCTAGKEHDDSED